MVCVCTYIEQHRKKWNSEKRMGARDSDNDEGNDDDFEALKQSWNNLNGGPNAKATHINGNSNNNSIGRSSSSRSQNRSIFNHPIYNDCNWHCWWDTLPLTNSSLVLACIQAYCSHTHTHTLTQIQSTHMHPDKTEPKLNGKKFRLKRDEKYIDICLNVIH